MKIVHVYAKNLDVFIDAVKDTDCRLNASQDINYLIGSLQNYNARDVMGLIIYANPVTKKCLKLIRRFDELFVFKHMPIIVVSDMATEMYNRGYFKVRNSNLYLINSEEDTISDIEVSAIFTTLLATSDMVYDLSICPPENKAKHFDRIGEQREPTMSPQLAELLESLKRSEFYADSGGEHTKQ